MSRFQPYKIDFLCTFKDRYEGLGYIGTKNLIGLVLKEGNKILDKYIHDKYKNLPPEDIFTRSVAQFKDRWVAERCFAELYSEIEQDNDTFGM